VSKHIRYRFLLIPSKLYCAFIVNPGLKFQQRITVILPHKALKCVHITERYIYIIVAFFTIQAYLTGYITRPLSHTLTVYIKRIREKLGSADVIRTVKGVGYRVEAPEDSKA
jgi:hypothetical protein